MSWKSQSACRHSGASKRDFPDEINAYIAKTFAGAENRRLRAYKSLFYKEGLYKVVDAPYRLYRTDIYYQTLIEA